MTTIKGSRDQGIKGSRDQGIKGSRDQGIKGSRDQGIKGSREIVVVGDSIAAGCGIKRIRNRFSDLLAAGLPDDFVVLNMGRYGSDTRDEFIRLTNCPRQPSCIVLQYFVNDIEAAALDGGLEYPKIEPYSNLPYVARPFVRYSFFLNYVYWTLPQSDLLAYKEFWLKAISSERIVNTHVDDLYAYVDLSQKCGIPLIVVLFPSMTEIEWSQKLLRPVQQMFESHGVKTVNITPLVEGMSLSRRVVNLSDEHPSEEVHRLVACKLLEAIKSVWDLGQEDAAPSASLEASGILN